MDRGSPNAPSLASSSVPPPPSSRGQWGAASMSTVPPPAGSGTAFADSFNCAEGYVNAVVRGDSFNASVLNPPTAGDDDDSSVPPSVESSDVDARSSSPRSETHVAASPKSSVPPSPPSSTSSSPPSGQPPSRLTSMGRISAVIPPRIASAGMLVVAPDALYEDSEAADFDNMLHIFSGHELIERQRIEIEELEGRFERLVPLASIYASVSTPARAQPVGPRQSNLRQRQAGHASVEPPRRLSRQSSHARTAVSSRSAEPRSRQASAEPRSRQGSTEPPRAPSAKMPSFRSQPKIPSTRLASSRVPSTLAPPPPPPPDVPEHHFVSFSLSVDECDAEEMLSRRAIETEWSDGRTSLLQIALMWAWRVGSTLDTHRDAAPQYTPPGAAYYDDDDAPPPRYGGYDDSDLSPSIPSRMCSSSPHRSFKMLRQPVRPSGVGQVQHQGWLYMARGGADAVWVKRFVACIQGTMYCGRSETELSPKVLFRAAALLAVENDDRLKASHGAGQLSAVPFGAKSFGFLVILPPPERPVRSPSPSRAAPQTRTMRFAAKTAPERATWMAVLRDGMTSPHPFLSTSPPRQREPTHDPLTNHLATPSLTPRR
eukprot:TRINITY_DN8999_c0_g1_i1.p1 TRINITY_DN8999_c0_g1~~TRINITY_DN8999_c0_g1_i1.p1  ORF type:complete len:618 (+),score=144.73 TRINITY_DN8999_c0_g1_i1:57-1856(+)